MLAERLDFTNARKQDNVIRRFIFFPQLLADQSWSFAISHLVTGIDAIRSLPVLDNYRL